MEACVTHTYKPVSPLFSDIDNEENYENFEIIVEHVGENQSPQNLQICCRLCGKTVTEKVYHIYEENKVSRQYKINFCLPINVQIGDGYPNSICETCDNNLQATYEFVCNVVYADKLLRESSPLTGKSMMLTVDHDLYENNNTVDAAKDAIICQLCGEVAFDKELAVDHAVMHPEQETVLLVEDVIKEVYLCEFCSKCFIDKTKLKVHSKNHCSKYYSCNICNTQFLSYARCLTHKATHKFDENQAPDNNIPVNYYFTCEICQQTFLKWIDLDTHRKDEHTPTHKRCVKCRKLFKTPFELKNHLRTHHVMYPKMKCSKKLPSKQQLQSCITTTHDMPCVCPLCGKIFKDSNMLHLHTIRSHPDNAKICDICGLRFQTDKSLEMHKKLHEKPGSNMLTCTFCTRNFKSKSALQNHTKVRHSGSFTLLVGAQEEDSATQTSEASFDLPMETFFLQKNETDTAIVLNEDSEMLFLNGGSCVVSENILEKHNYLRLDKNVQQYLVDLNNYPKMMVLKDVELQSAAIENQ